jgi:hypothetical protein
MQEAHAHVAGPSLPQAAGWVIAASTATAAGVWLGAEWLKAHSLGMPVGLWLIGIAGLGALAYQQRQRHRFEHLALTPTDHAVDAQSRSAQPTRRVQVESTSPLEVDLVPLAQRWWWSMARPLYSTLLGDAAVEQREHRWIEKLDGSPAMGRPLRIGLDVPGKFALNLAHAAHEHILAPVQFVPIEVTSDGAAECREQKLDAVMLVDRERRLVIQTLEHDEHDAAWFDWAQSLPISYASVFPSRIDASRITLDTIDTLDDQSPEAWWLIVSTLVSAAALARSPRRLTLRDRLDGRRSMVGYPTYATPGTANVPAAESELLSLARLAESMASGGQKSQTLTSVLRALSGWMCVADTWTDARLRRRLVEAAAQATPEDVAVLLRLAAVRFADGDDISGFESLLRADKALRGSDQLVPISHLEFVQSEIDLGSESLMTLGRVAAGICLACAAEPDDRLDFIREDIMDDARYSSWLSGRDQDAAVLLRVFKMLKHARALRALSTPIPPKSSQAA